MRRGALVQGMAVLAVASALALPAFAQRAPKNPNISAAYWRCMGAVNINSGNQNAIDGAFMACARREHAAQDKKLNEAYQNALQQLEEDGKKRLRDIQRAWLRLRDDNCAMVSERNMTGSGRDADRARCVMEWTANRAHELSEVYYSG